MTSENEVKGGESGCGGQGWGRGEKRSYVVGEEGGGGEMVEARRINKQQNT